MLVLGVDQALRHTAVVAIEVGNDLGGDYSFHVSQIDVSNRGLSEINDVFSSVEKIMAEVKRLAGDHQDVYVCIEKPLDEVRMKPEEHSRYRGGAWGTNNQLAMLYGFLVYAFVSRGWKVLNCHPSMMRTFMGVYKSDSVDRGSQWEYLHGARTTFYGQASWRSDHVCEAFFFCLLMVYLISPHHDSVRMDSFHLEPIRRMMLKHEERNFINWALPNERNHGQIQN